MARHPFRQAVAERHREYDEAATNMLRFSEELLSVVGFDRAELEAAEKLGITFEAGDYLLKVRNCYVKGRWQHVFIAAPRSVGCDVGWSNIEHNPFPDGWICHALGTGTAVYPEPHIAAEVVRSVKALAEKVAARPLSG